MFVPPFQPLIQLALWIGKASNETPSHLLRFVLNESQSRQNMPSVQGSSSSSVGGPGIPQPPPGMSFYAAKRVIGDSPWTPELLEQVLAVGLVLSELGVVTGIATD